MEEPSAEGPYYVQIKSKSDNLLRLLREALLILRGVFDNYSIPFSNRKQLQIICSTKEEAYIFVFVIITHLTRVSNKILYVIIVILYKYMQCYSN